MNKKIKYAIVGLATGCALIVLVATAIPHFIDENLLRPKIIEAVQQATGRELTIEGAIKWSVFPEFNLEANQVHLANPADSSVKSDSVTIDQLNMSVALIPLLFSQTVVVDEITASNAVVNVTNHTFTINDLQTDAKIDPGTKTYVLYDLSLSGETQGQKINVTADEVQLDPVEKLLVLHRLVFDGFGTHATGDLRAKNTEKYPEVTGQFKLDQLLLNEITLTDINLPVTGHQGQYTFQPVTGKMYDGTFSADITLDVSNNTPKWQFNYQVSDVQAHPLFQQAFSNDKFSGVIQSNGQLNMTGLTHDEIVSSLTGPTQTKLSNGSIQGVDFSYWWQVGNKLLSGNPDITSLSDNKRTDISQLAATFNIKNGIGTTNNLTLYNDVLFIRGSGQVDFVHRSMNMIFYVSENKNGQPSGVAIPLIVSGPFGNVSVTPDAKTIAAMATKILSSTAGKTAMKAIEKNVPQQLQQPLNNAVNKLLGR